jgi:hypothetical protein
VAKAHEDWKVLPHDPIERVTENLWRVEGSLGNGPMRRVMTLVRLADGRLVIHNAMALEQELMDEIEAWGTPAFLIVPNGYHRLDARVFKVRYPQLQVLCPAGARKRVEQVVAVDGDYDSFTQQPECRLEHLEGTGEGEGMMLVRSEDGATLVLNDIMFNMPHRGGVGGLMLRYVTQSSGGPTISRLARMFFIKDAAALKAHLERLAATEGLKRIIVSHHEMVSGDAPAVLQTVAAAL